MNAIFLLFGVMILIYCWKNHLHIDFLSFFKKGFTPLDNRFGVYCYCGKQGTGKTYSAVEFCDSLLLETENYVFITNLTSYYESVKNEIERGSKGAEAIFIPDLLIIMKRVCTDEFKGKNVIIFFDEIFTALEKTGSLRGDVLTFLSQCRKRGIIVLTTCQEWTELNITLRRYVRYQIDCSMKKIPFINKAIVFNNINDGDSIHWDPLQNEHVSDRIQTNIRKGRYDIILRYDTFETIKSTSLLNKVRA